MPQTFHDPEIDDQLHSRLNNSLTKALPLLQLRACSSASLHGTKLDCPTPFAICNCASLIVPVEIFSQSYVLSLKAMGSSEPQGHIFREVRDVSPPEWVWGGQLPKSRQKDPRLRPTEHACSNYARGGAAYLQLKHWECGIPDRASKCTDYNTV